MSGSFVWEVLDLSPLVAVSRASDCPKSYLFCLQRGFMYTPPKQAGGDGGRNETSH